MNRRVTDICFSKMPVNAVQYRLTVGTFNNRKLIIDLRFGLPSYSKLSNNLPNYDQNYISILFCIFLITFLFSKGYVSGDVEVNPGPKNSVSECLSVCCWYLNSISAHDYSKLFLLKACILAHKSDIICLSETYLDSTVPLDAANLVISGYNLICSDYPSNTRRRGVCLYYKNYLPLRVLNISYLKKCLNFELKVRLSSSKKISFIGFNESSLKMMKNFFISS